MPDVSASVAAGISEAIEVFSICTMVDRSRPGRWLRGYKVESRKSDEIILKCNFWLLSDPEEKYNVRVMLHPLFSSWIPSVAHIINVQSGKKTCWKYDDNKWVKIN